MDRITRMACKVAARGISGLTAGEQEELAGIREEVANHLRTNERDVRQFMAPQALDPHYLAQGNLVRAS